MDGPEMWDGFDLGQFAELATLQRTFCSTQNGNVGVALSKFK